MTYGLNEDGWDEFASIVREEFEFWAVRKGFDIMRVKEYPWLYESDKTNDVWRAYHLGHVRGRDFG